MFCNDPSQDQLIGLIACDLTKAAKLTGFEPVLAAAQGTGLPIVLVTSICGGFLHIANW